MISKIQPNRRGGVLPLGLLLVLASLLLLSFVPSSAGAIAVIPIPTPPPSAQQGPCSTYTENDCQLDLNGDGCVWDQTQRECLVATVVPTQQRTPKPTMSPNEADSASRIPCTRLNRTECTDSSRAGDCVAFPRFGCRARPSRVVCTPADVNRTRTCLRNARLVLKDALIEINNAATTEQRDELNRRLYCETGPGLVRNATRECVRKCVDDDRDELLGLTDAVDWCDRFSNGSPLEGMIDFLTCNATVLRTCEQIVGAGLAENEELAPLVADSASGRLKHVSAGVALISAALVSFLVAGF